MLYSIIPPVVGQPVERSRRTASSGPEPKCSNAPSTCDPTGSGELFSQPANSARGCGRTVSQQRPARRRPADCGSGSVHDVDVVAFDRPSHRRAPAAAHVEQRHPGLQTQLCPATGSILAAGPPRNVRSSRSLGTAGASGIDPGRAGRVVGRVVVRLDVLEVQFEGRRYFLLGAGDWIRLRKASCLRSSSLFRPPGHRKCTQCGRQHCQEGPRVPPSR